MRDTGLSRRRMLAMIGTGLSATAAGCAVGAPQESGREPDLADTNFSELETPDTDREQVPAETRFTEVYRAVVDSVAAVRVDPEDTIGAGGGTAWVYEGEHLVTNEHVIRQADSPFVWFENVGWREAEVVGSDVHSDLAVIAVDGKPEDATPLPMVETEPPVGTEVAAIGNPFGLTGSFTTGIISGRDRNIRLRNREFSIADGVQVDAALNPGNSGGPVITLDGEVIGVVSAGQGDNTGFAISAAMTQQVVPSLIEDGSFEHSFLGIRLRDVIPPIVRANDLPVAWGVYVTETVTGEAADGVLRGSSTTTEYNGREVPVGGDVIVRMDDWVIETQERLSAFLALETQPGDEIEIEVVRDGERRTVDVTLGSRPD